MQKQYKKNHNHINYIFIIIIFLFYNCKNQSSPSLNNVDLFDITPIVKNDITYNQRNAVKAKKIIKINGKQDIILLDTINWKKELNLLLECNINKEKWKGKYNLQLIHDIDTLDIISYTSNTPRLPITTFTVFKNKNNNKIEKIEIEKNINSGLFSNKQDIIYYPQKSFKIKAIQKAFFMQDFNSTIEVIFVK